MYHALGEKTRNILTVHVGDPIKGWTINMMDTTVKFSNNLKKSNARRNSGRTKLLTCKMRTVQVQDKETYLSNSSNVTTGVWVEEFNMCNITEMGEGHED
jgi:hypothetical protein